MTSGEAWRSVHHLYGNECIGLPESLDVYERIPTPRASIGLLAWSLLARAWALIGGRR